MDFFTLIGIVLSLFGGTYTGIVALHELFDKNVDACSGIVVNCRLFIKEGGTDETKAKANKNGFWFRFWRVAWLGGYIIPLAAFMLFSFVISIHACVHFFSATNTANTAANEAGVDSKVDEGREVVVASFPAVGERYMYAVATLTGVDILCVLLTGFSYCKLQHHTKELQSGQRQVDEMIKKPDASGVVVGQGVDGVVGLAIAPTSGEVDA